MPAKWKSIAIEDLLVAREAIETVTDTFDSILAFTGAVRNVLRVIKAFLLDLGNPIRTALQIAVAAIEQILNDLDQAGVYSLLVLPEAGADNSYSNVKGGIDNFLNTVVLSLEDVNDPNRPQFSSNANVGGFVLVADSGNIATVMEAILSLLKLFGINKKLSLPAPNPVTVKMHRGGVPILRLLDSFDPNPEVMIQWQGFGGITEWQVERSRYPNGLPYIVTKISDSKYTYGPADSPDEVPGANINQWVGTDKFGSVVRYFDVIENIAPTGDVDQVDVSTGIMGFLTNAYTYVDKDATLSPADTEVKTYYYRVRAKSGSPMYTVDPNGKLTIEGGILGSPSYPVSITIPSKKIADIRVLVSRILWAGFNVSAPCLLEVEEKGGLTGNYRGYQYAVAAINNVTDNNTNVRSSIAKTSALQWNTSVANGMAAVVKADKGRLEADIMAALYRLPGTWSMIEKLYTDSADSIERWQGPGDEGSLLGGNLRGSLGISDDAVGGVDRVFIDTVLRKILKYGVVSGVEPNWSTIRPLREFLPPVSELLNALISELKALMEAYDSTIKDIIATIDMLDHKIEKLESLIKMIENIILEILNLRGGFYLVYVDQANSTNDFLNKVQEGVGAPSDNPDERSDAIQPDPNAYTAGITILYGGPSFAAIKPLWDLILGAAG